MHVTPDELSQLTEYVGIAYNALEARPEGDFEHGGLNPGIKTTRFIFNLTYCNRKEVIYNGQPMQEPDQVEFTQTDACAAREAVNAYSGQTSYRNELSQSIEVSGKFLTL